VPEVLLNRRVVALDLASLVAGTKYRGEFEERIKKVLDEIKRDLDLRDRVNRWMLAQFEVYLVLGCLKSEESRAEALALWRANASSGNPVERSYAQQTLRFAEKIQYDLYSKEVGDLVSQIGMVSKLTAPDFGAAIQRDGQTTF